MAVDLTNVSTQILLKELLLRHSKPLGVLPHGPVRQEHANTHRMVTIGIGADHTANISLHQDDWDELVLGAYDSEISDPEDPTS